MMKNFLLFFGVCISSTLIVQTIDAHLTLGQFRAEVKEVLKHFDSEVKRSVRSNVLDFTKKTKRMKAKKNNLFQ